MDRAAPQALLKRVPGSNFVLLAGLFSLPLAFFGGVLGIATAMAVLWKARKARNLYQAEPGAWDFASYQNLVAGRILAQIGLVVSILCFYLFFGSFSAWLMGS